MKYSTVAICFHILLLSLLTVGRFRVSVSPTNDNCPWVNELERDMVLVPCPTFGNRLWTFLCTGSRTHSFVSYEI